MISKYNNKGLVWIDLTSPKEEEILYILEEYQIPESIKQEICSPSKEHHTFIENDVLFSLMRLPHFDEDQNSDKVIFIKNQNYIITIHDQPMISMDQFSNELELDMMIESESKIKTQELLFANLIRKMMTGLHDKILLKDMNINSLKKKLNVLSKRLKILFFINVLLLLSLLVIIFLWL